jgi:hypothetical protein
VTTVRRLLTSVLIAVSVLAVLVSCLVTATLSLVGNANALSSHVLSIVETPAHRSQISSLAFTELLAISPPGTQAALHFAQPVVTGVLNDVVGSPATQRALRDATDVLYAGIRHDHSFTLSTRHYLAPLQASLPAPLSSLPPLPNWTLHYTNPPAVRDLHVVLVNQSWLVAGVLLLAAVLLALVSRRFATWRRGLRAAGAVLLVTGAGVIVAGDVVSSMTFAHSTNPWGVLALRWTAQMVGGSLVSSGVDCLFLGVAVVVVTWLNVRPARRGRPVELSPSGSDA